MNQHFRKYLTIFRESFRYFIDINALDKGASLSYYSIFALPPIVVLCIVIAGALFGQDTVRGQLFQQFTQLLGPADAKQLLEIVAKMRNSSKGSVSTIIGILTFLIASTGVFISMQSSLNSIWCVKSKPENEILKMFADRVLSFCLILCITFLLVVSLAVNTFLVALSPYLKQLFSDNTVYLLHAADTGLMLLLLTLMFASIYKVLPDVRIRWSVVWVGSLLTAVLFTLGRTVISLYLGVASLGNIYGAASLIILLLIWTFYSSQLLFYGAIFTRIYAQHFNHQIYPSAYAVRVVSKEIELGKSSVVDEDSLTYLIQEDYKPPHKRNNSQHQNPYSAKPL